MENFNHQVYEIIDQHVGKVVRLRVNSSVTFCYCGLLDKTVSGGYIISTKGGPEVVFDMSAIRAIHYGPTQDMLCICI